MTSNQSGSVLILALMALAIISGIATNMLTSTHKSVSLASRVQSIHQIKQQLLGGEAWAKAWLYLNTDQKQGRFSDNLLIKQVFETDNGKIEISVYDQGGCFNINLLHNAIYKDITKVRLKALSSNLGVSNAWVDVLADWVDEDQVLSSQYGKEDNYYLSQLKPYRTGGGPFLVLDEWGQTAMSPYETKLLAPYLCALPPSADTLNFNRAKNIVIQSYYPEATDAQISQLFSLIDNDTITSISDLDGYGSTSIKNFSTSDWNMASQFFSVIIKFIDQNRSFWLHTKLKKGERDKVSSYYRAFAPIESYN